MLRKIIFAVMSLVIASLIFCASFGFGNADVHNYVDENWRTGHFLLYDIDQLKKEKGNLSTKRTPLKQRIKKI
ncbi:hypothetical protein E4665_03790 [Sporolactobacillus shoreae]|uniref:Uncharacterized protein n=1 Tax=Sporolactobacillus shoreae TaxID=1465501 RepID=A0A4Z0GS25_9BACL|nr:hypothetical protein [Sporolactobacillus shoreae]TGA99455.1 hypothetical protein E4665_03790 [Sporolactobacillus shoreae]